MDNFFSRRDTKTTAATVTDAHDLHMEDMDDDVEERLSPLGAGAPPVPRGTPLSASEAIALKEVVLGSAMTQFSNEWKNQFFSFNENKTLFYGLLQNKGGPCGVLAAVQAHLIVRLFFGDNKDDDESDVWRRLAEAVADILWRVGDRLRAVVVHQCKDIEMRTKAELAFDGVTEHVLYNPFDHFLPLVQHVHTLLLASNHCFGVISLIYSCLLTRGCGHVRTDMDAYECCPLIGRHNYCTQELVNLLLTGRAVSNVFDGNKTLDKHVILRGLRSRPHIGFLSLHEHSGAHEVGSLYKSPSNPVFVVFSESHFSVLFAKHSIEGQREFKLFHYDGMGGEEVVLEVTTDGRRQPKRARDGATEELERVVRTKWPKADIT